MPRSVRPTLPAPPGDHARGSPDRAPPSQGALAFNAATRIVEVPVPFIIVHLHTLLLLLLVFFGPVVLSCYIGHVAMSSKRRGARTIEPLDLCLLSGDCTRS